MTASLIEDTKFLFSFDKERPPPSLKTDPSRYQERIARLQAAVNTPKSGKRGFVVLAPARSLLVGQF